jgi:hypothetical protein
MADAAYWRAYRAANRDRLNAQQRARRATHRPSRGDRSAESAGRPSRAAAGDAPLPVLFPKLVRGVALSFWEDELRMDLHQERILAALEGRDPDAAAKLYRAREVAWHRWTGPLLEAVVREAS